MLKVVDITVKVADRVSKVWDRPWEISCLKLYFSVNFENFVEVYVNVNGILLPIRKGEMVLKTIQEVAKEFNVSTRTIRYYEELGLLCPHRSSTNQRTFSKKNWRSSSLFSEVSVTDFRWRKSKRWFYYLILIARGFSN